MYAPTVSKIKYTVVPNDPLKARIYTLDNGLKVYLSVFKDEPRIQTAIAVRAGAKNDPPDTTGLAHYLEHLLFKGTDQIGTVNYQEENKYLEQITALYEQRFHEKDPERRRQIYAQIDATSQKASQYAIANEYDKMITTMGGRNTNAYTSMDQTVYVTNIPANRIATWLKIETERFRNPVLRLFHTELEVVYEEKNRSLDNDRRKIHKALNAGLFPRHPYGNTVLGRVEHLKNPSINNIYSFFKTWYVPANMAICLSGDFNPDRIIKLIDATFGQMPVKTVPKIDFPYKKIEQPVFKTIYGPDAESVTIGFRLGAETKDRDLLSMVDMVLMNGTAGLIDLELNQKQKVRRAYTYPQFRNDYSIFTMGAGPRQGQSPEEVRALLLAQIEKVKSGLFPDWLPAAIVENLKLDRIKRFENNRKRIDNMINAFIKNIPWKQKVERLDRLSQITKNEIIAFARKSFGNNYTVINKLAGQDPQVIKIKKPAITPVQINNKTSSSFFKNILKDKPSSLEPVFLNFSKDIEHFSIGEQIPVIGLSNNHNDYFKLSYVYDAGTNFNPHLQMALHYLKYLGTPQYRPAEIQQKFFQLACKFSTLVTPKETSLILTGLKSNLEPAVKLLESLLRDAVSDDQVLARLKIDLQKNRADAKLSKSTILWKAMQSYGVYGQISPFTNVLSSTELNSISGYALLKLVKKMAGWQHRILYYGPDPKSLPTILHTRAERLLPVQNTKVFKQLPTKSATVYLVEYDMQQVEILLLCKKELFNPKNVAIRNLFNKYYGGSMGSIVFQTMRESQALAYSVYAAYTTPKSMDQSHFVLAYIGTQADKLMQSLDSMLAMLNTMTESKLLLETSREAVIKGIQSQRITRASILKRFEYLRKLGLSDDTRRDIYNQVPQLTMEDIKKFHLDHISNNPYTIMILGNPHKIDPDILKKYGPVRRLTLKELFGY